VQRGQPGDLVGLAGFVNTVDRQRLALHAHGATGGIRRAPRLAQGDNLGPQGLDSAHERRAADSQSRDQLACGLPAPGSQGMKELVGARHETISNLSSHCFEKKF
jgi:hypothetical protein